jgi:phosphatidylglycerophosphatase C
MQAKTLVLFDFDGTLTTKDTFFGFNKFLCGKPKFYLGLLLYAPYIALFLLKILNADYLKRTLLYFYLKQYTQAHITNVAERYYEHMLNNNILRKELIATLNGFVTDTNTDVAIVSASPAVWLLPACNALGTKCIATQLEFNAQGYFTGNFIGLNCNDEEKVQRIKQTYNLNNYTHIIAYGNSIHDAPMLALAHQQHWIK